MKLVVLHGVAWRCGSSFDDILLGWGLHPKTQTFWKDVVPFVNGILCGSIPFEFKAIY